MVENIAGHKYLLESAHKLFPDKPIFISPITLKQRFNVVATSDASVTSVGELPPQIDQRQNTIFAAQWLLGSLKQLAQSATSLVTLFESVGWRGLIQGNYSPLIPGKFSATRGDIFPLFKLLMEFNNFNRVLFSSSSAPLLVEGIVIQRQNSDGTNLTKIILTNFSTSPQKVKISAIEQFDTIRSICNKVSLQIIDKSLILPSQEIIILE